MFIKKVSTGTPGKEFQLIVWELQGRSASWCPAPKADMDKDAKVL